MERDAPIERLDAAAVAPGRRPRCRTWHCGTGVTRPRLPRLGPYFAPVSPLGPPGPDFPYLFGQIARDFLFPFFSISLIKYGKYGKYGTKPCEILISLMLPQHQTLPKLVTSMGQIWEVWAAQVTGDNLQMECTVPVPLVRLPHPRNTSHPDLLRPSCRGQVEKVAVLASRWGTSFHPNVAVLP